MEKPELLIKNKLKNNIVVDVLTVHKYSHSLHSCRGIFFLEGRGEVEQTRIVSSLFVLNARKRNPPSSSASEAARASLLEEEPALPFAPASSCQASSVACLCRLSASPAASHWCIIHPSSPRAGKPCWLCLYTTACPGFWRGFTPR